MALERLKRYARLCVPGPHRVVARPREMEDLERAVQLFKETVDQTPVNHPERAGRLPSLGIGYLHRYQRTGEKGDLETAIQQLQDSLDHSSAAPRIRLRYSGLLLTLYAINKQWSQAYQAAFTAVSLIPLITPRSLGNSDKQHVLADMVGLASDAAAIALQAEKSTYDVLSLLELGRGIVL